MLKNNRGILLVAVFMVIAVISVLLGAFLFRNVWDAKNAVRYKQNMIALHCAEAGMDKAIAKLPSDATALSNVALRDNNNQVIGEYDHTIAILEMGKRWRVESWGYVPDHIQPQAVVNLEAYISKKDLPDSFCHYRRPYCCCGNRLVLQWWDRCQPDLVCRHWTSTPLFLVVQGYLFKVPATGSGSGHLVFLPEVWDTSYNSRGAFGFFRACKTADHDLQIPGQAQGDHRKNRTSNRIPETYFV